MVIFMKKIRGVLAVILAAAILLGVIPVTYAVGSSQSAAFSNTLYADQAQSNGAQQITLDDGTILLADLTQGCTFPVVVESSGEYLLEVSYINSSKDNKTITLQVDDAPTSELSLAPSVSDATVRVHRTSVTLTAGSHALTLKGNVPDVKLEGISLARLYEAENAIKGGSAKVNTDHTGFSGTGFADGLDRGGGSLTFSVETEEAGTYYLDIRYSAGRNEDGCLTGALDLVVNGTPQENYVLMPGTGDWDTWDDRTVVVDLHEGTNEIKLWRNPGIPGNLSPANVDYITLKRAEWLTPGMVNSYTQTSQKPNEVVFHCDNADVLVKFCDENVVKVWCEPTRNFARNYESFAVVKEDLGCSGVKIEEQADAYLIKSSELQVKVSKAEFRLTYLDNQGNVLCEGVDSGSLRWSNDEEVQVRHKLAPDEIFWGFGEKIENIIKNHQKVVLWSTDYLGAGGEAYSAHENGEVGSYYSSNPQFISSKGYSILFDNTARTVFDMGKTDSDVYSFGAMNPMPGGELCYYFISDRNVEKSLSVKTILTSLTDLIGKSFFAPYWALGNFQCHYGYWEDDVRRVANEYQNRGIPLDGIMVDLEYYQNQCSPSTVNTTRYPDFEGMNEELERKNLKFGVINDPNISNQTTEPADYAEGSQHGYFIRGENGKTQDVLWNWGSANGIMAPGMSGVLDFFNPAAAKWWQGLNQNILDAGVDWFWLDMNEPARYRPDWLFYNEDGKGYGDLAEMHNAYSIVHNKTMYEMMTAGGKRSVHLTRSGFTGTQRYGSIWTGDIADTWQSMVEQIRCGTGFSLAGQFFWGFDIGGFSALTVNPQDFSEQYQRWIQLATFTPMHRFHYCGSNAKEPWAIPGGEETAKKYIGLRYQLSPYFYSYMADSILGTGMEGDAGRGTGLPLFRPMLMEYPDDPNTYSLDRQFMNGQYFLIAPVVESSDKKDVYFPQGLWYDYSNGQAITLAETHGALLYNYDAPVEKLPIFVKAGAIIPTMQPSTNLASSKIEQLTLDIYPLKSGASSFVQYEDDGETMNGAYATTKYTVSTTEQAIQVELQERTGSYKLPERGRDGILKVHLSAFPGKGASVEGLTKVDSLDALKDGTYFYDPAAQVCYVGYHDNGVGRTFRLKLVNVQVVDSWEDVTATVTKDPAMESTAHWPFVDNIIGQLQSGTFEGWYEWHSNTLPNVSVTNGLCTFHADSAYEQSVHNVTKVLPKGEYRVTLQVRLDTANGPDPEVLRMELGNQHFNVDCEKAAAGFTEVTGTITMDGKARLDIGLYAKAAAGTTIKFKGLKVEKLNRSYKIDEGLVPVTGVELNTTTLTLTEGGSEQLTATVRPENATNRNVTWSSNNTNVATVNNGVVTAVGEGVAIITATAADGNTSAACTVTVTKKIVESNLAEIAKALEGKIYTVSQSWVNTGAEAEAYMQPQITALLPESVTGTINAVSFTAAKAGSLLQPEGVDGKYVFTVTLTDGTNTHTTNEITLQILATDYDLPIPPIPPIPPILPILPILPGGGSDTTDKPAVQTEFYDVAFHSWYYDAVSHVTGEGLMTGVGNSKFNPDGAVTRAMVWTVLARMDGENTDGGSTWYSKAQSWAMRTGVSDGTNPMGSITREQLAAMLYRFEGSPAVSGNLSAYPDANTVSDWAKDALVWATQTGLIKGMGGNLSPKTGATRAQLATMLMRFEEAQ